MSSTRNSLNSEHKKLQTSQFSQIVLQFKEKRSSYPHKKKTKPIIIKNTITDTEGRYIIVNVTINNKDITIASIYGPNEDDGNFFHNFFLVNILYICISQSAIIIGGDFNTVINPVLDKSNNPDSTKVQHTTDVIKQYMTELGLGDNWRQKNPTMKEYTYFSPVHKTYSRIDFFLTSNSINSTVSHTTTEPIIISDHVPVTLSINLNNEKPTYRW